MDKIGPIFPPHLSVVKVEVNLAARREGISSDGGCPLKTLLEYGWLRDHNVRLSYTPVFFNWGQRKVGFKLKSEEE